MPEPVVVAAEAMRLKRAELQAQPLDRIWRELAATCLNAFDKACKDQADENVRRLSRGGAN